MGDSEKPKTPRSQRAKQEIMPSPAVPSQTPERRAVSANRMAPSPFPTSSVFDELGSLPSFSPRRTPFTSTLPSPRRSPRGIGGLRFDERFTTPERTRHLQGMDELGFELSPLPGLSRSLSQTAGKSLFSPIRSPIGLTSSNAFMALPDQSPLNHVSKDGSYGVTLQMAISSGEASVANPFHPFMPQRSDSEGSDVVESKNTKHKQKKKRAAVEPTTDGSGEDTSRKCNCKNSKCLKLYCVCFKMQQLCDGCNCVDCLNTSANIEKVNRQRRIKATTNPTGFGSQRKEQSAMRGCHCKKGCQKKYCECFSAGVACRNACKCLNCANVLSAIDPSSEGEEEDCEEPVPKRRQVHAAELAARMAHAAGAAAELEQKATSQDVPIPQAIQGPSFSFNSHDSSPEHRQPIAPVPGAPSVHYVTQQHPEAPLLPVQGAPAPAPLPQPSMSSSADSLSTQVIVAEKSVASQMAPKLHHHQDVPRPAPNSTINTEKPSVRRSQLPNILRPRHSKRRSLTPVSGPTPVATELVPPPPHHFSVFEKQAYCVQETPLPQGPPPSENCHPNLAAPRPRASAEGYERVRGMQTVTAPVVACINVLTSPEDGKIVKRSLVQSLEPADVRFVQKYGSSLLMRSVDQVRPKPTDCAMSTIDRRREAGALTPSSLVGKRGLFSSPPSPQPMRSLDTA